MSLAFVDETNEFPNSLTKIDLRNISYMYKQKVDPLPKTLTTSPMTDVCYRASSLELSCKINRNPTDIKEIIGENNPYMNVIIEYNKKQYKPIVFDMCCTIDIDTDSDEDDVQIVKIVPPPSPS